MPAAPDLDELLAVAVDVATAAGALLLSRAPLARTSVETKSSGTDMVTEVDRASEALIGAMLAERRPDDALVGEEGTARPGTTGVRWIVDPLDGTTNYLYGFPVFAVSVAAELDGSVVAGAVRDAVHDETFTAALDRGSWCNRRALRIAGPDALADALVGTGFAYDAGERRRQAARLPAVLPAVRDIRRGGAAALDLCWVGLGRLDAYFERGLQPWDSAAGGLVAAEAGARVDTLADGTMVAAPPHLFDGLVALLGG
ncbi:MAG TPA: inositol monophosphatase family protein [Acidimicrobiales bacterium]|nr:inositol monophosphatase family protein [Acidimicrobiales bacterium]